MRCEYHNAAITSRLIAAKSGTVEPDDNTEIGAHGRDSRPALNAVIADGPRSTNAERDVLF